MARSLDAPARNLLHRGVQSGRIGAKCSWRGAPGELRIGWHLQVVTTGNTITVPERYQVIRMLNLTLKNVPPALHQRLKVRAESNRRSLNGEILALLETSLDAPTVDVAAEQRALEAFVSSLPRVDHARVSRYRDAGRE